ANPSVVVQRRSGLQDLLDARLAAQATAAARVQVASQSGEIDGDAGPQDDLHHVVLRLGRVDGGAVAEARDPARIVDHAFGRHEPPGELLVVSGRTHHDGHRDSTDADLEWFLAHDDVVVLDRSIPAPLDSSDDGRGRVRVYPATQHVAF